MNRIIDRPAAPGESPQRGVTHIAEYLLLSSMRTARPGGIQITLFCRVTQPASHRVAGDRMRDVDDRDDDVGALAL